jgi:hypothetical protein
MKRLFGSCLLPGWLIVNLLIAGFIGDSISFKSLVHCPESKSQDIQNSSERG